MLLMFVVAVVDDDVDDDDDDNDDDDDLNGSASGVKGPDAGGKTTHATGPSASGPVGSSTCTFGTPSRLSIVVCLTPSAPISTSYTSTAGEFGSLGVW